MGKIRPMEIPGSRKILPITPEQARFENSTIGEKAVFDSVASEKTIKHGTSFDYYHMDRMATEVDPLYGEATEKIWVGPYKLIGHLEWPTPKPETREEGFRVTHVASAWIARTQFEEAGLKLPDRGDVVRVWNIPYFDELAVTNEDESHKGYFFNVVNIVNDGHMLDNPDFSGYKLEIRRYSEFNPERRVFSPEDAYLAKSQIVDGAQPMLKNWALPVDQVHPVGPAGGDLTGNYPNPTLATPRILSSTLRNKGDILIGLGASTPGVHPIGPDGYTIICDSTTSTGLRWVQMESSTWQVIATFTNSWQDVGGGYGSVAYLQDLSGFIHLRGVVTGGTLNTTIFTLPVGFRPQNTLVFPSISGSFFCSIQITSDGQVTQINSFSNSALSLANIIFDTRS
jgi:hypothetical protein